MHVPSELVAHLLQRESRLAAVELGAMHQQAGWLVDRHEAVVEVEDWQHRTILDAAGGAVPSLARHTFPEETQ
jgi:predicted transcriptional regulator